MLNLNNLQRNVSLAPLTTYKVGGPAKYFVSVSSTDELAAAVRAARSEHVPYFLLGTGANILIGDRGFAGLVIHNRSRNLKVVNKLLTSASGATIAELITATTALGLSGLEHFAGIPSSVGGAIWQNLHFLSPDRERTVFIGDILESAVVLDESGKITTVGKDYFQFDYDASILHHRDVIVLEATFALTPGKSETMRRQINANLAWRRERQPQLEDFASCGSVFKKIEGVGAGRLIDHAGLKGRRIGDAQVSAQHANFIVNLGHATASDIRALMQVVQEAVLADSGYQLETEIGFVGEF